MGRRTQITPRGGTGKGIQAQREIRRASHGNGASSFGIQRGLHRASAGLLVDTLLDMQEAGRLPDDSVMRVVDQAPSVTLIGQNILAQEARRGRWDQRRLGVARARLLTSAACSERLGDFTVKRGEIHVSSAGVYADIIHEGLEGEIDAIHAALGAAGVRHIARREEPPVPHLAFMTRVGGAALTALEQEEMRLQLHQAVPTEFDLNKWDILPNDIFA
jgi:hypothetical protein